MSDIKLHAYTNIFGMMDLKNGKKTKAWVKDMRPSNALFHIEIPLDLVEDWGYGEIKIKARQESSESSR